jgi:protein-S-isoprenylcysteine O-methyltransferase Ste14
MQDTAKTGKNELTSLTAINIAKGLTIVVLVAFAIIFGVKDMRQAIYLCLHIGYCIWWLLEQWLFPPRQKIFSEPVGFITSILIFAFVGVFYALPGYFAFTNPNPLSIKEVVIALPLYIFGTLINTAADVQKLTAKELGQQLVSDNIWRLSRNINYFGDLMRYTSFSVIAGSIWAYILPLIIAIQYLSRIIQKEKSMSAKYPEYPEYQQSSARLIPFIW